MGGFKRLKGIMFCWMVFFLSTYALSQIKNNDPLPSWNEGPSKKAIVEFVRVTTDQKNRYYVPPTERIATFDQDGTTWVSHPMYTQMMFAFERIKKLAATHPQWKTTEPFKSVLAGNTTKLTLKDLEQILVVTHTGMSVEQFQSIAKDWLATAKHPRWNRPYTQLVYQPMLELMHYLRANGYKTYLVTGGGQDFVRVYAQKIYGIPPEQVIGSAIETQYVYRKDHQAILLRAPKLLLNNNFSGKPQDIYLMIGRKPQAAFGNSTGDQQMLEYTESGKGPRLMMLLLHDDAIREYAYGPAQGLPETKIGTFTQALYDEAVKHGWVVISMKKDWRRIFAF